MKVLVVEDDDRIRAFVTRGLKEAGHLVQSTGDGEEGLRLAMESSFDAAVLDLMLPNVDGLVIVRRIREQKLPTAILVLSARRAVEDRVTGLEMGADDYLAKPFVLSELLARLAAITRRARVAPEPSRLEIAGVMLDPTTRQVSREGRRLDLTAREFALLAHLMRHPGTPVSKAILLESLWHFDFDPQTNVVDVLVCRLRAKVDKGFERQLIHTLRGVGYAFGA